VEYILDRLGPKGLLEHIRRVAGTLEGLGRVVELLPPAQFPPRAACRCLRCDQVFDPNYPGKNCRMPHPYEMRQEQHYRRKSEVHCLRCNKRWTRYQDRYGSDGEGTDEEMREDGGLCYEGPHEACSKDMIRREGWPDLSDDESGEEGVDEY
jgi:hypothetical protein